ncbi:hypothetical protein SprV_0401619900 [Sparganum proliferum]
MPTDISASSNISGLNATTSQQVDLLPQQKLRCHTCTKPHGVPDDDHPRTPDAQLPPSTTAIPIILATTTATMSTTNAKSPTPATDENTFDASLTTILIIPAPTTNDMEPTPTFLNGDHTSTQPMCLVGHLRIHRAATYKPMTECPAHIRRICLHCPHKFAQHTDLFGHMRIHGRGTDRNIDTQAHLARLTTLSSPALLTLHPTAYPTPAAAPPQPTQQPTLPPHMRIDLIDHLRNHRPGIDEPVPGTPTYTLRHRPFVRIALTHSTIALTYSLTRTFMKNGPKSCRT